MMLPYPATIHEEAKATANKLRREQHFDEADLVEKMAARIVTLEKRLNTSISAHGDLIRTLLNLKEAIDNGT